MVSSCIDNNIRALLIGALVIAFDFREGFHAGVII